MELTQDDIDLLQFCEQEFSVTTADIQIVLRHYQRNLTPIPMLLWQFGIISIKQLDRIHRWSETQSQRLVRSLVVYPLVEHCPVEPRFQTQSETPTY